MNMLRRPDAERILGENDYARMPKFIAGVGQCVEWFTPEVEEKYCACWRPQSVSRVTAVSGDGY